MLVPIAEIDLRQDENGAWIAKSDLLPGCHAYGKAERKRSWHSRTQQKHTFKP